MKRLKTNPAAPGGRSTYAAFALCSACLSAGALAGCFSGAYAEGTAGALSAWRGAFLPCLVRNLSVVGGLALLASSCLGFLLLPLLAGAAGFFAGFVMSAAFALGGDWLLAFRGYGWLLAFSLPFFLLLCAEGVRLSAALLRTVLFGLRVPPGMIGEGLKLLAASAAAAVVLAAAQSVVGA